MLKVGFISPSVTFGGAHIKMFNLMRHTPNIEWKGVAPFQTLNKHSYGLLNIMKPHFPIYSQGFHPTITRTADFEESVNTLAMQCDMLISWGVKDLPKYLHHDVPVVHYLHCIDDYVKSIVKSNESVDKYFLACSDAVARGVKSDAKVLYNGIDYTRVTPVKGRAIQRELWGIPAHMKIVAFIGRFNREKRPEDLIKAVMSLPPDWVGIYVGTGDMKNHLASVVAALCPQRIAFVDPTYHVGDVLAAVDCVIMTSDNEGHGLSIAEAMACGVPCVYKPFEVMMDLHEKYGELGVLYNQGDDLGERIIEACTESDAQFGRLNNAKRVIWNYFNIALMSEQFETYMYDFYNDHLKRKRLGVIRPVLEKEHII